MARTNASGTTSAAQLTEAKQEPGGGPRHDATRSTASAPYHRPLQGGGFWTTTAAWGWNTSDEEPTTDAFLVETNLSLSERNALFGRAELARKTGEDLAVDETGPALGDRVFTVSTVALGFSRSFGPFGSLAPGIGVRGSVNFVAEDLEPFYGTRTPVGMTVFINLRPRRMMEGGMGGMRMPQEDGRGLGAR